MVPRYEAGASITLDRGSDFSVEEVVIDAQISGASRWQAEVDIPLTITRDSWVVVMVSGSDGVSEPLWPINPQDIGIEGNDTLDDLLDGNLGEAGNRAIAFTNPLFLDFDGNGSYDPPGFDR